MARTAYDEELKARPSRAWQDEDWPDQADAEAAASAAAERNAAVLPPAVDSRLARVLWRIERRLGRPRMDTYVRAHYLHPPISTEVIGTRGGGLVVEVPPGLHGFVRRSDLPYSAREDPSALIGQSLEGLVIAFPPQREWLTFSPRHLARDRCREAQAKGRRIRVSVIRANQGGVLVDALGLPGFVPRSEMWPRDSIRHEELVGTDQRLYVIKASGEQMVGSVFSPRVRARRAPRDP